MPVGAIKILLIHHSGLTCKQYIGRQTSKKDETFFLTNHSLSFAYSPPTFQFCQISQAAAKNVSCCCASRSVFHATSWRLFPLTFPGKRMLLTLLLLCSSCPITCLLRCKSMSFDRLTQCVRADTAFSVLQWGYDTPHLPIIFFYFTNLQVLFFCHLFGHKAGAWQVDSAMTCQCKQPFVPPT